MKFTKPISREVDIDGSTFVVTMDEDGIGFRLKGRRRLARARWADVLDRAEGENGADARDYLGVEEARDSEEASDRRTHSAAAGDRPSDH